MTKCDIAIVGAGAAGLAAAIAAGEADQGRGLRIALIDGEREPGAKILVSGGGRCNVTNKVVTPQDFWGGPRPTIRKVLNAFDVRHTIEWFERMGVKLKLEQDGKYFPVTDRSNTVLDALLRRASEVGVRLITGTRVTDISTSEAGFEVALSRGDPIRARCVIVATGGLALPKSGSDGAGMMILERLGHTIVPTTPALSPLLLKSGRDIGGRFAEFSGVSMEARLRLIQDRRLLIELSGALLFTHFGVSGPVALNLSRHWLRARLDDPQRPLLVTMGVLPLRTVDEAERWLTRQSVLHPRQHAATVLNSLLPERLAKAMAEEVAEGQTLAHLTREQRRHLARHLTALPLPVIETRGYAYAEATAGGVDLREIDPGTMQSRKIDGLFLCGEILDVDGRIGGFNFQWAWSSGHVAGREAGTAGRAPTRAC
jgi:hypothetical protein